MTRFGRRCWGETKKEEPDARNPSTVPAGIPAADHRAGPRRTPVEQLAREFEPSANAIRKWVKQALLNERLRIDGLTTSEREELNRLRREKRGRLCKLSRYGWAVGSSAEGLSDQTRTL